MIRTEAEYREALKRLREGEQALREQERKLKADGASRAKIKRLLDPSRFFQGQIRAEVECYESLARGEFEELHNLHGLGPLLIALRIAAGVSQRELAERLGVHESQVSRDERNEYHGITVDRAGRILEALGADLKTTVQRTPVHPLGTV